MIRAIFASGDWIGTHVVNNVDDDVENIQVYIDEGTPVLLVEDERDFDELGIEVEMV